MYARYLQVNVCVGFSVCWGSRTVVALGSDHVSLFVRIIHPPVRLILSTRAVLRACLLYRLLPYVPQVGGSIALSALSGSTPNANHIGSGGHPS